MVARQNGGVVFSVGRLLADEIYTTPLRPIENMHACTSQRLKIKDIFLLHVNNKLCSLYITATSPLSGAPFIVGTKHSVFLKRPLTKKTRLHGDGGSISTQQKFYTIVLLYFTIYYAICDMITFRTIIFHENRKY